MTEVIQKLLPDSVTDKVVLVFAAVLSLFLTYALFFYSPDAVLMKDSVQLGKIVTKGTVRRRHAGSLHWSNISGNGNLYLRDFVYTPKDTRAEIVWDNNKRLTLEPDSMVQFDEVTLERIAIVLLETKGKDQKTPMITSDDLASKREERVRILPYPKSARLAALQDITFQETYLDQLTKRVSDASAKYVVLEPVTNVPIPKLSLNRLVDYEIALLEPATKSQYNLNTNRWMKMSWSELPLKNFQYELQLAKDPKFKNIISHATTKTELSIQLDDPGTYYWRVRAIRGREFVLSSVKEFTMQKKGGIDPFTNRLPTELNTPSTVSQYQWEISKTPDFDNTLRNSLSKNPTCPNVGLPKGIYFCRIRDSASNELIKEYKFAVRAP